MTNLLWLTVTSHRLTDSLTHSQTLSFIDKDCVWLSGLVHINFKSKLVCLIIIYLKVFFFAPIAIFAILLILCGESIETGSELSQFNLYVCISIYSLTTKVGWINWFQWYRHQRLGDFNPTVSYHLNSYQFKIKSPLLLLLLLLLFTKKEIIFWWTSWFCTGWWNISGIMYRAIVILRLLRAKGLLWDWLLVVKKECKMGLT